MIVRGPKALGALIRNRRRELGLDQADLARRVGTTRHWIMDVEKGKPTVELARVLRTLEALKLDLDVRPKSGRPDMRSRATATSVPKVDIDLIIRKAKRSE